MIDFKHVERLNWEEEIDFIEFYCLKSYDITKYFIVLSAWPCWIESKLGWLANMWLKITYIGGLSL